MTKYRVMWTWTASLHNLDASVTTKTELLRDNLTKEAAESIAAEGNARNQRAPKHPKLVTLVPGENIFHEPDRYTVEPM
jgi:hypothetical protein